ncbi:MAG TPA: polysaccharide biosynthesis tyrosine autokinase, partial [Gemmatirosa sp.]
LARTTPGALRHTGFSADPDTEVLRLRDLTGAVRRRWPLLAGGIALGLVIAAAYMWWAPRMYEGIAMLRLDDKQATLPAVYTRTHDVDAVVTEVEVLRARAFAARTVDALGLRVEVASAPRGVTRSMLMDSVLVANAADTATYRFTWSQPGDITVTREGAAGQNIAVLHAGTAGYVNGIRLVPLRQLGMTDPIVVRVRAREATIDELQKAVHVTRVGPQANAISLRYDARDPSLAQGVLSTWIDAYLSGRQRSQSGEARSTAAVLRAQLDTLNVELATSEDAFQRFRERERVVSPETEATTQVSRLAQLQADRASVDAEQRALSELLSSVRDAAARARPEDPSPYRRIIGFPTLLRNQSASQLLNSLSEVENQRAVLLTRRTAIDPDVRILTNRVHELEDQVRGVAESYLAGLSAQVAADDAEMSRFGAQLGRIPQREVEYARLQRQPAILSQLVSTLATRLKEAQVAEAIEDPSVQVVDPPYASTTPVQPRLPVALALGLFAGSLVGGAGVFARERVDRSVRTRSDVASASSGPVIGAVPTLTLPPPAGSDRRPSRRALRAGTPAVATRSAMMPSPVAEEAYTRLYLNVIEGRLWTDGGMRSLVVTSPLPGDGKTTSAVNLALTLARRGIRTALVDADLRRGGVDTRFNVPRGPGLAEVLRGSAPLAVALRRLDVGRGQELTYLTTGALQHDAPALLTSDAMRDVHTALRDEFQAIIFDTPPLAAVTDATVLAALVDGVILVARAGTTGREAIEFAAEELRRVHAPLVGTMLNDVDPDDDGYGAAYYAYAHTTDEHAGSAT